jgi:hypothetical protein
VLAVSDTISIAIAALVSLFTALTVPIVLVWINERQRHKDKEQDYQRQDYLIRTAATAADALVESNKAIAAMVDNNKTTTESIADGTAPAIKEIHSLVNSRLTDAIENGLANSLREIATLNALFQVLKDAGQEPTIEQQAQMEAAQARVVKLRAELAERATTQAQIDKGEPTHDAAA